jgi:hypothetical protein
MCTLFFSNCGREIAAGNRRLSPQTFRARRVRTPHQDLGEIAQLPLSSLITALLISNMLYQACVPLTLIKVRLCLRVALEKFVSSLCLAANDASVH